MKLTISELRKIIRESIFDSCPGEGGIEGAFSDGPDVLSGYILVTTLNNGMPIGYAPITRTDGPDRPFLVRTTDTRWFIPHDLVMSLYPQVEDAFNFVDSKEDWRLLGPGSSGQVGNFAWQWVEDEPVA